MKTIQQVLCSLKGSWLAQVLSLGEARLHSAPLPMWLESTPGLRESPIGIDHPGKATCYSLQALERVAFRPYMALEHRAHALLDAYKRGVWVDSQGTGRRKHVRLSSTQRLGLAVVSFCDRPSQDLLWLLIENCARNGRGWDYERAARARVPAEPHHPKRLITVKRAAARAQLRATWREYKPLLASAASLLREKRWATRHEAQLLISRLEEIRESVEQLADQHLSEKIAAPLTDNSHATRKKVSWEQFSPDVVRVSWKDGSRSFVSVEEKE